MFRVLVATGRSVQQRSPPPLRYIRHFHSTIVTRQQSSTAGNPSPPPTLEPKSSSGTIPADPPPSPSPSSTHNDAIEPETEHKDRKPPSHGTADDTARPMAPIQSPALKPVEQSHIASETDPAKPVKRGRGRPAKPKEPKEPPKKRGPKPKPKVEGPPQPPKKRGPKPKPKVEKPPQPRKRPGRKPKIPRQGSAEGENMLTLFENRAKAQHSSFTTRNIREDYLPYLQWARGFGQGKSIGDTRRINIVSQSLCDDTITRLEPSLQKHIGCDIIDVNPGIGVWSEKLHNLLKPRTHILLEPDHRIYQPVLQPLVDAPGSTYKLIPKSGLVWGHMEKILSKEYLPHQEPLTRGDPRLEEPNDTLLFVANLGHYPKRSYRGFASIANLVLYQFMSATRSHSLFQRYGQVRMLIWIENEEKDTVLPQTVSLRRKAAIEAAISCNIQEVASGSAKHNLVRARDIELESIGLVYEKMKEMGVAIPEDRRSSSLDQLITKIPPDAQQVGSLGSTDAFLEELRDLEAQYARGELGDLEHRNVGLTGRPSIVNPTPKLNRLRILRSRERFHQRKFEKRAAIKTELDEIFATQREVHRTIQGEERRALEEALKQRTDAWKRTVEDLSEDDFENTLAYLDTARIFETKPPSLMWDRRDYEPLKVHSDEFIPLREMCLLDIQPKSLWPILQQDFPNNYDVLEYILSQLLIIPTQNIRRGLSALFPGAYDYLIAECPSLTDPTKGGSLDVELLSVRCLTEEMLKEIIEAWVRWPFKPNRFEIMSKLGSATYDSDAAATDQSDD